MILLIDNYDSFVHNLARYFARLGQATRVVRNDEIDAAAVRALRPAAIVLSPGPCAPQQAGCSLSLVKELHTEFPILGVCLGHQTIAMALGAYIKRAPEPIHGRASAIHHAGQGLFKDLPLPFQAGRYHSLLVDAPTLPACLSTTAWTEEGLIMAIEHLQYPVFGVQFHPESILTECGYEILAAFLEQAGLSVAHDHPRGLSGELLPPLAPAATTTRPVTF